METVKIDIQKLQLLNDRIAQTIDALNQVRMSMHSIQHSSSFGYSPYGQFGQASPFGQWGSPVGIGYGVNPYGSFVPSGYGTPFSPFSGLQHTTSQVPGSVWGSPFAGGFSPFGGGVSPYGGGISPYSNGISPYGSGVSPFGSASPFGTGLAHTTWDPTWMRTPHQMFPFTQTAWTPTTIY